MFPFIGAALVAISRTEDYRHHWQDVFIGALLGTICAYFAYRQYYPALGHNTCHTPFMTRILYCQAGLNNNNNNKMNCNRIKIRLLTF